MWGREGGGGEGRGVWGREGGGGEGEKEGGCRELVLMFSSSMGRGESSKICLTPNFLTST